MKDKIFSWLFGLVFYGWLWAFGIFHSFAGHGKVEGFLSIVIPPLAYWNAVEGTFWCKESKEDQPPEMASFRKKLDIGVNEDIEIRMQMDLLLMNAFLTVIPIGDAEKHGMSNDKLDFLKKRLAEYPQDKWVVFKARCDRALAIQDRMAPHLLSFLKAASEGRHAVLHVPDGLEKELHELEAFYPSEKRGEAEKVLRMLQDFPEDINPEVARKSLDQMQKVLLVKDELYKELMSR